MFVKCNDPKALAKEIFWLAWNACGGPEGMGIFQDLPSATKDDVWDNITCAGDYPGGPWHKEDSPYADYVFGRMMKFGLDVKPDGIEIREKDLRSDYQSWCTVYKTVEDLVEAALISLSK